jgi:hypothetical protein
MFDGRTVTSLKLHASLFLFTNYAPTRLKVRQQMCGVVEITDCVKCFGVKMFGRR